jgi:hypothetical protein
VKHALSPFFLLISLFVAGQGSVVLNNQPFQIDRKPDSAVIRQLGRQAGFGSMHQRGKEMLYWINILRRNPQAFKDRYLYPFLQQFPEANSPEAKSLAGDLDNTLSLGELSFYPLLQPYAQDHADFLAQKGTITHTGRGGKSFQKRMLDAGIETCAGENLFDGQDDALVALILLLIDKGVPGAGHRKALLNPQFHRIAVGIAFFDQNRMVVVQQFSCGG